MEMEKRIQAYNNKIAELQKESKQLIAGKIKLEEGLKELVDIEQLTSLNHHK